ncbi:MAG: HEPN domain-containing protein [Bacteroidales bacterium]|nr:HEPN domain-containing protein [Bacteroidales bacterium]
MSRLKEKSNFNIDAANALLKQESYAPSVHCSYYSCFQLLKYTIKHFYGIDYETQAVNRRFVQQKSHQYVINYITNELKEYVGFPKAQEFKRKIKDLKQFREESDYEDIEINCEKGNNAYNRAKDMRIYIIKNFNV